MQSGNIAHIKFLMESRCLKRHSKYFQAITEVKNLCLYRETYFDYGHPTENSLSNLSPNIVHGKCLRL